MISMNKCKFWCHDCSDDFYGTKFKRVCSWCGGTNFKMIKDMEPRKKVEKRKYKNKTVFHLKKCIHCNETLYPTRRQKETKKFGSYDKRKFCDQGCVKKFHKNSVFNI